MIIIKQFYKAGFILFVLFCNIASAQPYDVKKTTSASIAGQSYFCIGLEFLEDISFGRLTFNNDGSAVFIFDEVALDGTYLENGNNFTINISSLNAPASLSGKTGINDRIIVMVSQGLPYALIDEYKFVGFRISAAGAAIE